MKDAVEHSFFLGDYRDGQLIGYCRLVTDYATFGWLCDVYVHEPYRGSGISKILMRTIVEHPEFSQMKRLLLITRDDHGLYSRFGFKAFEDANAWMERDQRNSMRV